MAQGSEKARDYPWYYVPRFEAVIKLFAMLELACEKGPHPKIACGG